MTGTGLTRLAIIGLVITALEPQLADIVSGPTWLDYAWNAALVFALTSLPLVIVWRWRQRRLEQTRDKDWRTRRDLRSRGA